MKKSQRLQRIANLSQSAEQIAAQAFSRARDEVTRYATQIRELERYRDEYLRQFERDHPDGLDGYRAQKLNPDATLSDVNAFSGDSDYLFVADRG